MLLCNRDRHVDSANRHGHSQGTGGCLVGKEMVVCHPPGIRFGYVAVCEVLDDRSQRADEQ
eukprot:2664599-Rhodomonas_salina.1